MNWKGEGDDSDKNLNLKKIPTGKEIFQILRCDKSLELGFLHSRPRTQPSTYISWVPTRRLAGFWVFRMLQ